MGSIVLGIALITATTIIIIKILNMCEKADERIHDDKHKENV